MRREVTMQLNKKKNTLKREVTKQFNEDKNALEKGGNHAVK